MSRIRPRGSRLRSGRVLRPRVVLACGALAGAVLALGSCGQGAEFAPEGEIEQLPDSFTWPRTKAASSYMLRIFGADGSVLFESKRLTEPKKAIGAKLEEKLVSAGTFTWRVRIYDGDRIAGRSDPLQVRLAGNRKARSSP